MQRIWELTQIVFTSYSLSIFENESSLHERTLHDYVLPHTTLVVRQFLAVNGVVTLHHPAYSPDLAPVHFFLFPKYKSALKGEIHGYHQHSKQRDSQAENCTERTVLQEFPGLIYSFPTVHHHPWRLF
ncbi:hypothetical protein TNCV_839131 [Trichonephila clavipes]|nr:hypothetical protein TNCV_839131 [Trichonephila clavipes]